MLDVDKLMRLVLEDASRKKEDAAWGGSMSDGGASRLEDQVKFYQAGRAGTVPDEWNSYTHLLDPEWGEYARLKNKFQGR